MGARVTSKGQITIPVGIRKQLGITYGDTVDFHVRKGQVVLEAHHEDIDVTDLRGVLHPRRRATDKEIRAARTRALRSKWGTR